jgi:ABC-type lipoprotein release transport system permease subunit
MPGMVKITTRLAWRNLWRNHRRTLIMLATISIGIWAMIFMTSLMRGMVNEMVRSAIKVLPGHVQVHHLDYQDDPNVVNSLNPPQGALLEVLEGSLVTHWASRVRVPAVVSSAREARSVTMLGIHPEQERNMSFVADDIIDGRYLDGVADNGVIVGRKLVDTLETGIGKRIVVMSQNPENEISERGFRIIGIFESSPEALEEQFIFTGRDTAQQLLDIGDRIHEIAVVGPSLRDTDPLYQRIELHTGKGTRVLPWNQIDSYLGTMLGVMDGFVLIWIVVIFLALSFGLVNTLVMAVFERVREIGLMLALGMKPVSILMQIITESVLLLLIGILAGNILALVSIYPLRGGIDLSIVAEGMEMFGSAAVLYPEMNLEDIIRANVIVVILGVIASLSPALRASRYQPVEALTKS